MARPPVLRNNPKLQEAYFIFSRLSDTTEIRTIGNSNVKSKIDKNVILLLYGQFLLFYCPNSIVLKTFYI